MKRILFFITSLAGGGAEKVLVNMVNHMDKSKYEITVQTLFDEGINKQFLYEDVIYRSVFKKSFRGNIHLFKLFSPEYLYKKFVAEKYDIVVSYFQGATTRIIAGCNDDDTKLVQWIHNEFHKQTDISKCYRSLNECVQLQKKYDATVCVAQSVKEIYTQTFPNIISNPTVLYNVVEDEKILALSNEDVSDKMPKNECFNLISVGRMVEQKAFDRLIRIVGKLINEDKINVHLYLLGNGELLPQLKNLAKNEGVEKNITFLGYDKNPYRFVKNADLFVCSSLHEGYSTAVTEALIVGTPVITTECSGMRELLGENQEYGVITENNEKDLYIALKELLCNDEKLKEIKLAAQKRSNDFSYKNRTEKIEKFFDEL